VVERPCFNCSKVNTRHLTLATLSFALCFAVWGLVGALAPVFRQLYNLTATETALLVAAPVLLGSLARLPMGFLTDRLGGRAVFTVLLVLVSAGALLVPQTSSYSNLVAAAFFIGLAGSSFAVGVGYVSRWTTAERQGSVLGVYGLGTMGQSAAVFFGPILAAQFGWPSVFHASSVLVIVWAGIFFLLARDAPETRVSRSFISMFSLLARERLSWILGLFYFLTFGGFVAFSIYLPTLLRDEFRLTPADAGFRAAGFAVLATLMRPVGGWLADHMGGSRVLSGVFLGLIPFALLLAWSSMVPFTVGALGCAALLGIGNGAVFKLVPQYFPNETGTVTGLVGAMGGLGGFFPPLLLGIFRDYLGIVWPGFVLLSASSLVLWRLNARVFLPHRVAAEESLPAERQLFTERVRAGAWAMLVTGILIAAIVVGSRNLQNFDAALVIYTFAIIFTTWGVAYHYYVWLQKPPTKLYWRRTLPLLRKEGISGLALIFQNLFSHIGLQTFIYKRSPMRWWMHQLIFWGCLLAVAVTFPLVFGWIRFGSTPADQMQYITYLFGFPVGSFQIRTATSWVLFHALDFAAVMVLTGVFLSLWRRMRDQGVQAVQSFAMDFFPLILLTAISLTGLALTASTIWLRGNFYDFIAIFHAITVVAGLLYLPFGKCFHIFQRPAQLGVKIYQEAGRQDAGSICLRCGERFASKMHIDDLKLVLKQLGFNYSLPNGNSWQDLCPACKRKSIARAQLRLKEDSYGRTSGR
jgi:NNP family nitrate/nitrite transporter-like MFS transporter